VLWGRCLGLLTSSFLPLMSHCLSMYCRRSGQVQHNTTHVRGSYIGTRHSSTIDISSHPPGTTTGLLSHLIERVTGCSKCKCGSEAAKGVGLQLQW
jgi:hypothetical protein